MNTEAKQIDPAHEMKADGSTEVAVVDQERQNQLVKPEVLPPEGAGMLVMPTNPAEMLAVAVTQGRLDVESMKALMDLEKEYRAMQAKVDFDKAVAKFAGMKEPIPHNRIGQAGKGKFPYADYPQMVSVITPWLKTSGLSFSHSQDPPVMEGPKVVLITVRCILKARSGHSEQSEFPAIPDERLRDSLSPGQLVQAAITLAKRQTLALVLGLSTGEDAIMDDDANTVPQSQRGNDQQFYSEEEFKKNFPKWEELVASETRTIGDIMSLLSSKGKLTDSQKDRLRSLGKGSAE